MSAQQSVFEGPDPEQLLLQAWSQHGTNVRISEPVRVRKGGIAGFFARLEYRIEVLPSETPAPAAAQPASISAVPSPVAPSPAAPISAGTAASSPLASLVEETEDVLELGSSGKASFDEVLEAVAGSLGEEPDTLSLPAFAPAEPPLAPADPPLATARPPLEAVQEIREIQGAQEVEEVGGPGGALPPGGEAQLAEALGLVGMPGELVAAAKAAGARTLEDAFAVVPGPRALPRTPGSLIAVVGAPGEALGLARTLARSLGIAPGMVPLAAPRGVEEDRPSHLVARSAREAVALAPGWRRDRVAVVAVALGTSNRDLAWGRRMLWNLAPSAVWALAPAAAKAEDLAHLGAALGGLDALCLEGLRLTLTPAGALGAGIPIARLDGVAASPRAWAGAATRALQRRASSWTFTGER